MKKTRLTTHKVWGLLNSLVNLASAEQERHFPCWFAGPLEGHRTLHFDILNYDEINHPSTEYNCYFFNLKNFDNFNEMLARIPLTPRELMREMSEWYDHCMLGIVYDEQ